MESEEDLMTLLKNIAAAKYPEIITFLLKLREVVWNYEDKQSVEAKNDILKFGILPILTFSLKQKFWKLEDGWNSSSKLARFLSELCISANPSDLPDFVAKMLPDALDSVLYLANRLQKKITLMADGDSKQGLLTSFMNIIDSTGMLLGSFQELARLALESIWLQQMLMSEDELTTPRVMALVQTVNKTRTGIFETISQETARQVMDELVYKILTTRSPDIVSSAARTIVEICKSCPSQVKALRTRYQGLKTYANRWIQEPFLGELLLLLDAGSFEQARLKKFEHQAVQIQSWWRSHLARKRLRQANSALSLFQRSFRERKKREELGHQEGKMQADLQYLLTKQRKYNMRKLHWRQLHAIQILPSSQVEKYLIQEQTTAATKIQAAWRRHAALRNVPVLRQRNILNQAAIKIQRAYRRYSTRKKQEEKLFGGPITLRVSEQRRNELQEQIMDWRENRRKAGRSTLEMERLHERVQASLGKHFLARYEDSGQLQHLEALMAHTTADADLLLSATDGNGIETPSTLHSLKSCSLPVVTKAKEEHLEKLRQLNKPWWKKLSEETERAGAELLHEDWRMF